MNQFDDREKAFEAKFHLEGELAFKVVARRDKLLGLWVAEKSGLSGDAAQNYARGVVEAKIADNHPEAMILRLLADLKSAGAAVGEPELRAEFVRLEGVAKSEIMAEVGAGKQNVAP
jgi:hypothetical protein